MYTSHIKKSPWKIAMIIFVLVLVVVCILMIDGLHHKRRVAKFNERFPPIDDHEFLRRCGPGAKRDVALRVRRIVSEQLGIECERIYPEQSLVDDLDCC